jgi:hypothetical protein
MCSKTPRSRSPGQGTWFDTQEVVSLFANAEKAHRQDATSRMALMLSLCPKNRNKAIAIRAYARQAKNKSLEADAFEIRLRAERRLGGMMAAQPKAKPPGNNQYVDRIMEKPDAPVSLADAGIDKNLAHRARRLNALS